VTVLGGSGRPPSFQNLTWIYHTLFTESISTGPEFKYMAAVQLHAVSIIAPELPIQPDVVEVHRSCAADRRAVLSADANANRIDIGEIHS